MYKLTLNEITLACGGKYYGSESEKNACITGVSINSREILSGNLFVCLKGENVDGHDFANDAYNKNALCCLCEKEIVSDKPYILVESCSAAIREIAEFYRSICKITVIGVTGSVGKTTMKEMIYSVISKKYSVHKTDKNLNNELGVPLTIFGIEEKHEIAVIEMGISGFGEMRRLAKCTRPDICVITNIGDAHLEFLVNREGVLKAKTEMLEFLNRDGEIYFYGGDEQLRTVKAKQKITYFGVEKKNDFYAEGYKDLGFEGTECVLANGGERINLVVPAPGMHMLNNALACYAVGKNFGLSAEQIKWGIEDFVPSSGRSCIDRSGKFAIIDDCYNANPTSVKASLEMLGKLSGRKVAILGDMNELGENSAELHFEIGKVAAMQADLVICIGEKAKYMAEGAQGAGYFKNVDDAVSEISKSIKNGDTVLVKASRGMKLERVVAKLKACSAGLNE